MVCDWCSVVTTGTLTLVATLLSAASDVTYACVESSSAWPVLPYECHDSSCEFCHVLLVIPACGGNFKFWFAKAWYANGPLTGTLLATAVVPNAVVEKALPITCGMIGPVMPGG